MAPNLSEAIVFALEYHLPASGFHPHRLSNDVFKGPAIDIKYITERHDDAQDERQYQRKGLAGTLRVPRTAGS
jgi:hypothetical protein